MALEGQLPVAAVNSLSIDDRPPKRMVPPDGKLTAVFFVHLSVSILPMIKVWLQAGHRAGAVVVATQRQPRLVENPIQWFALRWIVMRYLHANRIRIIEIGNASEWAQLRERLARGQPDVAICYAFMRLVPETVLSLFPCGGLNFHPALLPFYRGPKPLAWLALDGDWDAHGGVTLHEMNGAFDEGPIVAQARLREARTKDNLTYFVSNAIACMTRDVIPKYCAGELSASPQPQGVYPYAGHDVPQPVFERGWTRRHLQSLCKTFVRRPGITIPVSGRPVRLSEEIADLGPPSGEPATAGRWTVDFDLADRRVRYRRHNGLAKLRSNLRLLRQLSPRPIEEVPINLGPFAVPEPEDKGVDI